VRILWIILALIVAAAIVVLFQPPRAARIDPRRVAAEQAAVDAVVDAALAQRPAEPAGAGTPREELARDLRTERAETAGALRATDEAPAAADAGGESLLLGLDRAIPNATVERGRIVRSADGAIVADGRWTIRGSGVEGDPYVVSWDLLSSAMDTYQPRQGLDRIPQRVAMLDGARIRIEGYVAFPLFAQQTKELLCMQNQWDGCCIGVPPSAYDAIEVALRDAMPVGRRHLILFGRLEGVFRVEPYLIDRWLAGLYLLDDATIQLDL
jgi:hypothetical protein